MSRAVLLLFAALSLQDPDPLREAAREAARKTASFPYRYKVGGRFERAGEFEPPGLLTARIGKFQSARLGPRILVKGPEGLWKTPSERLGEQVEKPEKDTEDIVKTLEEAQPPHEMAEEFLAIARPGVEVEDPARRSRVLTFPYLLDRLRESVEKQMKKGVERGTLRKPAEVRWTTLKGSLRIWVDRLNGALFRLKDERSVKIAYSEQDVRVYRNEFEVEFLDVGKAAADLPAEVRERLQPTK